MNGGIGKTNQAKHDGVRTKGVELIIPCESQNLIVGKTCAVKALGGFRAGERMVMCVGSSDQCNAHIVADAYMFQNEYLSDFSVAGIELSQFFDAAGPHAGLIEGTVVGQRMAIAADRDDRKQREYGE